MTDEKRISLQYRFSGYLPPLISLDGSTDAGYWCKFYTHPYYINQPLCWKRPVYQYGTVRHFGNFQDNVDQTSENGDQLYSLIPVCPK
jgi:hypothetical protein